MIYLTRRERFSAAHRLFNPSLSEKENTEQFGPCANPNWHGHNYVMWVTVKGEVNPETGYVVNLKEVSQLLKEKVVDKLDHKNINLDVDFMKDVIVSTENLAIAIWNELEPSVNSLELQLHSVKIQETENNYVEYFGNV